MNYKFKEDGDVINVIEGENIIARYQIDRHYVEKNISLKDNCLYIRLMNMSKKYVDCKVELNNDNIQKIPQ